MHLDSTYQFELKNDLSELKALHRHLNKWGKENGLSDECISEINICLDELFTNIVSYGFKDELVHKVEFTLNVDRNLLIISIQDDGLAFNPLGKKPEIPVDVDSAKIGGLGIQITRELMDHIRYERGPGTNRLTLIKSFSEAMKTRSQ
jgi:anti-sigma regulatory factor (Ser/Thr protein kinase)